MSQNAKSTALLTAPRFIVIGNSVGGHGFVEVDGLFGGHLARDVIDRLALASAEYAAHEGNETAGNAVLVAFSSHDAAFQ